MKKYTHELGQAVFGQPAKRYECPMWIEAFLAYIDNELRRIMWNINQKEYESPFSNTANEYENDTFHVQAYCWNENIVQRYNFKYKDIEISWYKYCGRGMSINRKITYKEGIDMLNDCVKSLIKYEKENLND